MPIELRSKGVNARLLIAPANDLEDIVLDFLVANKRTYDEFPIATIITEGSSKTSKILEVE